MAKWVTNGKLKQVSFYRLATSVPEAVSSTTFVPLFSQVVRADGPWAISFTADVQTDVGAVALFCLYRNGSPLPNTERSCGAQGTVTIVDHAPGNSGDTLEIRVRVTNKTATVRGRSVVMEVAREQ